MNRKNKILVGCLALLLALSVGYALFSETITINGTATAKGDFDIKPTCTAGFDSRFSSYYDGYEQNLTEGGYSDDVCEVSSSQVSFRANLNYPGAGRWFTIYLKNNGSIDAKFDMNNFTETYGELCYDSNNDNQITSDDTCESGYLLRTPDTVFIGFIDNNNNVITNNEIETNENLLNTYIDAATNSVILPAGHTLVTAAKVEWDENQSYDKYNNRLLKSTITITYPFEQKN